MATLPDPAQNAATEPLRRFARDLLNRRPGDGAHLHWARVGGHEVWRVRQIATRWSVIVKCGADTATAREMAHSGVAPRVLAAEDASGVCVMEDVGDTTLALPVPHKYLLDFKMPLRYGTRHGGSDPGWRSPAG